MFLRRTFFLIVKAYPSSRKAVFLHTLLVLLGARLKAKTQDLHESPWLQFSP